MVAASNGAPLTESVMQQFLATLETLVKRGLRFNNGQSRPVDFCG